MIIDKILLVGVLSRYTCHLLPTCCQHQMATRYKETEETPP
jgi:hypothetical protein